MFLLLEKSTNIVRDIQSQTFSVTSDFEWVEDKGISDRSQVGYTYNKDAKQYTPPPLAPERAPELSQIQISAKLDELQAKIDAKVGKDPILGAAQSIPAQHNYMVYGWVLPLLMGILLLIKRKKV